MTDMLSPTVAPGEFTPTDKFMFECWGYFVIPDVLSADEVAECYEASARLHGQRDREFGQLGRGYEVEPSLERLIDHPAVLPKIRGLYGDRFVLQASWNTMQPGHAGVGRWHQDGSSAYDFKQLGYPVPLIQLRASFLLTDQSKPRMGNMELIPGSHRSLVGFPTRSAVQVMMCRSGMSSWPRRAPSWCSTTPCGTGHTRTTVTGTVTRLTTFTARPGSGKLTDSKTRRSSWSAPHRSGERSWASSLVPMHPSASATNLSRSPEVAQLGDHFPEGTSIEPSAVACGTQVSLENGGGLLYSQQTRGEVTGHRQSPHLSREVVPRRGR